MTTSHQTNTETAVLVTTPRKQSWVLCHQLYSFDESRLKEYMCTLTDEEMEQISATLALALDLPTIDPEIEQGYKDKLSKQAAQYEAQIAALKAGHEKAMAAAQSEMTGRLLESELQKRLYDRALDELVSLRMGKDLAAKVVAPELKPELPVEEPEEPEEVLDELVDVNRCGLGDLMGLGFSMSTAKMIIAARPYLDVDDLRGVPGVTRLAYKLVEKKITVGDTAEYRKPKVKEAAKPKTVAEPVVQQPMPEAVSDKVNINTASAKEISEKTGIHVSLCYSITGYRNKNGPYKVLEELLNVPRFSQVALDRCRDKMTV